MASSSGVAVVTGASAGIGRGTARALAAEGFEVGLVARSESELKTLAERIESDGGKAAVVPTDVTENDQITSMVESVHERFGGLDVLVNSAGIVYRESVVTADPDEWQRELQSNLFGLMQVTRVALEGMLERGSGHIVNVSSLNARKAAPGASGYTASKFGVNGFSEALRQEVTTQGVRVTVIEPGAVDTAMQGDEVREALRLLDPTDVANAIVYAVSQPEHVSINGVQIRPTEQEF